MISKRLLDDDKFVVEAVINRGENFQFISERLRGNYDILMLAFNHYINTKNSNILKYATDIIKINRKLVLKIVEFNNENIIDSVYDYYREDNEIIESVVLRDGANIKYCSQSLLQDHEYVLQLIHINSKCYIYLKNRVPSLFNDIKIILFTLKQYWTLFSFIPEEYKNNYECVLTALKENANSLVFVPEIFKSNKDIVLAALEKSGNLYNIIDKSLKNDFDIILYYILLHMVKNSWVFSLKIFIQVILELLSRNK